MFYFTWTGLITDNNSSPIVNASYSSTTNIKIAEKHLKYLEDIYSYHKDRQQTIENKNSLLIGQISIVISIISLFIPLFNEQLKDIPLWIKISSLVVFLFVIFHYAVAIYFALLNLEIHKQKFSVGSITTVSRVTRATTELDFIEEQISDLIYSINYNNAQINRIGGNLIYAGRNFKLSSFVFLALTICLISLLILKKAETPKINLENIKEITCCKDSVPTRPAQEINTNIQLINKIESQNAKIDTLSIKINYLIQQKLSPCKHSTPKKVKPKCPCPCS